MAKEKKDKTNGERQITIVLKNRETATNDVYVLDTSKMLFQQNEAVEKLLASIGYQEMMAGFFTKGDGSAIVEKMMDSDDEEDDAKKSDTKSADAPTNAAPDAKKSDEKPKASKEDVKLSVKIMPMLATLHRKLIEAGLRGQLACLLLVPEGSEWTPETPKQIEKEVLPRLTTQQVEGVIACFFTFDKLLREGFPTYLMGSH